MKRTSYPYFNFLRTFPFFVFLLLGNIASAQQIGMIFGKVTDDKNLAVELVSISILGYPGGTTTAPDGSYSLQVQAAKPLKVVFSFIGFKTDTASIRVNAGEKLRVNRSLLPTATQLGSIVVEDKYLRSTNLTRIDPRTVSALPTASGGLEALLKTMPGSKSSLLPRH